MRLSREPLFSAEEIQNRVTELAAEVSRDFADREVVAIMVLKGGLHFGTDLIRALSISVAVDFIRAKSYAGTESSGSVEFLTLPTLALRDKHILLLEDILDTGLTAQAILERVRGENPASVSFCALLDKQGNRRIALEADYAGFALDDEFVVGYGLDFEEQYRELRDIFVLEPET